MYISSLGYSKVRTGMKLLDTRYRVNPITVRGRDTGTRYRQSHGAAISFESFTASR
ncbi:hypothetical protein D3C84_1292910 [compost metagenome]